MTAWIGGIDEAGLGPLLGPLTIGWSVLALPSADADPWRLLARSVARAPRRGERRVVVADSKKVFTRNGEGRRRLERTALAFLAQREPGRAVPREPRTLLFDALRPDAALVERHPWYGRLEPLPRHHDAGAMELAAAALGRALDRAGVRVGGLGVRVVPAGELNASYRETGNKAETVWARTLEVLRHVWRDFGREAPVVTVDLQGARSTYGPLLARGFPDATVQRLHEEPRYAAYRLDARGEDAGAWRPRRMDLVFREKGEEHSFCVALASCLAKYARETVMEAFNAHFAALEPSLVPTAGYATDGRRWLADARPLLARAPLPADVLVRTR